MQLLLRISSLVLGAGFLHSTSAICQSANPAVGQSQTDQKAVAIERVISEVKTALADVQTKLANATLPPLKSVTLTLQTVATKKGGLQIKLWVVSIGHEQTKEKSHQVVIVLVPPKPGNPIEASTENLTKELEDAIMSAAEGVKNAGKGDIPLKVNSLSVEIGFTISADNSADANVKISPITLEFKGDLSNKAVNKIGIVFAGPTTDKTEHDPS